MLESQIEDSDAGTVKMEVGKDKLRNDGIVVKLSFCCEKEK